MDLPRGVATRPLAKLLWNFFLHFLDINRSDIHSGQLSVSFLGPCCPAPLYCIAVHDCLMSTERINDDDDDDVVMSANSIFFWTRTRQKVVVVVRLLMTAVTKAAFTEDNSSGRRQLRPCIMNNGDEVSENLARVRCDVRDFVTY